MENLIRNSFFKHIFFIIAILISLPDNSFSAVYVEPSTILKKDRINIQAGSYFPYKFTLKAGEKIFVKFKVSGGLNNKIRVHLLDMFNYQKLNAGRGFSSFKGASGEVRSIGSYSFEIPKTNIYYIVLDNTGALIASRNVDTYIYKISQNETDSSRKIKETYKALYDNFLKKIFIFDDFDITVKMCGFENAFSNPNITMCNELVYSLYEMDLGGSSIFIFMHEVSHSLLNLWDYPLYDNEDAADELATVLSIMAKLNNSALQAAEYWANSTSETEALQKLWIDDRHTISPQRARNIISWINNQDELLRRWMNILVPKIQQEILVKMSNMIGKAGFPDSIISAVKKELLKRKALLSNNKEDNELVGSN